MSGNNLHCGGIQTCPVCQYIWRREAGHLSGLCVICDTRHWPWEPHGNTPPSAKEEHR